MRKTRVLFVLPQLEAGGSERVVLDLARSLDPGRFETFVAAFSGGALFEPLKKICKDVFIIRKRPGFDFAAMLAMAKIVKDHGIDVVNAHHYMPCFYSFLGAKILNGRGLIYTEHSVPEVEIVENSIHGRIFHCMLYGMNRVVGVSTAITQRFRHCHPRHARKFHEIVNGVDIEKFQANGRREIVRSNWGLSPEHFIAGMVANFRKIKNHACLVRAACRLKDSHPHLRLFLVGTGFPGDAENSEEDVRALIRRLGMEDRVVLPGYQENIAELLSAFDAFCLTSYSEGMPVSILEAMAAGVLVIGSDVSGISEVIAHGQTGLLFPPDDDGRLADLLREQMADNIQRAALANRGFEFVKKGHSRTQWVRKYEDIFADAVIGSRQIPN